jgi:hypothetical protein
MKRGANFSYIQTSTCSSTGLPSGIPSPTHQTREVSSSRPHTSYVCLTRLLFYLWWFSLFLWWSEPISRHTTSCPQFLPNIRDSCTFYHTRLRTGPSLMWFGDCYCIWTPPMLCAIPSFLQTLGHTPLIGLPRLQWLFFIGHWFEDETQCSYPILSPKCVVCLAKRPFVYAVAAAF